MFRAKSCGDEWTAAQSYGGWHNAFNLKGIGSSGRILTSRGAQGSGGRFNFFSLVKGLVQFMLFQKS